MSKLCRENVGKTFEVEIDDSTIVYKIIDNSFDHEFGTQEQYDWEIVSIGPYHVPDDEIKRAIEKDL